MRLIKKRIIDSLKTRTEVTVDIPLGVTLKEAGIRNGDYIEIVAV